MPTFEVTDPTTGKTLELTGDSPPTEQELEEIFKSQQTTPPLPSQADLDAVNFLKQNTQQNPNFGVQGISEIPQQPIKPQQGPTTGVIEAPRGLESKGQFLQDTRQFGEALKNESLPIGGAIVGGILGGPGGAALGAAGGEGFKQIGQNFGFFGGEAPQTSTEAADRMFTQGLTGGLGESVGRGLVKAGSKAGRGFKGSVTDEGREAIKFFEDTAITLNPAKPTDSRVLDVFSNAGEASFVSGNKFLTGQLRASEMVDDHIDALLTSTRTGNREVTGALFQDAVENTQFAFKDKAGQLFKSLDNLSGGIGVDIRPLKATAGRLLKQAEAASGAGAQKSLLRDILKRPDSMSFEDAQILRSSLLSRGRVGTDPLANQTVGMAKKLSGEMDGLMESAASGVPGAKEAWRKANSFWKKGLDIFNNKMIKAIVREDPSQVSKKIFTAARDNPDMIRRLRKAIGNDTETWRAMQGEVMDKIIKNSLDTAAIGTKDSANIVSEKLLTTLRNFGGQDKAALKAMFPKRQDLELAKLARIKGVVLKGQPDSTGRFAVQIGQIAALASVATGKLRRRAVAILLGPEAIARAFARKDISKFLTDGLKINPNTAEGLKQLTLFTSRFAAQLKKADIEHEIIQPLQDAFGAGIIGER